MFDEPEGHSVRLYSLILLMVVMWSANYIVGKFVLREFPPLLVVGLRMIISGVTMMAVYAVHRRRTGQAGWSRRDLPLLLTLGVLGVGLNQLLFVSGLAQTTVAHAAITIALTPMLVLLLAAADGQERLNPARFIGMVLAFCGVMVLQVAPQGSSHASWTGDLLVLGAGLTFAAFTVKGKAAMGRVGGVVVNMFAYAATGLFLLPLTVYLARDFDFHTVSIVGWAGLLYMATLPSVVGYLIYYHALSRISASRLSTFSYLQPLLATLMAIPALGEYPTRSLLMGGVLVLAGVFVAERV